MADIGQAIQWLRSGKKIRREVWSEETYIFLDSTGDVKQSSHNAGMKSGRWETQANLWAVEGILAHDWEVYSQPHWKVGDTAYLRVHVIDAERKSVYVEGAGRSMWVHESRILSEEEVRKELR